MLSFVARQSFIYFSNFAAPYWPIYEIPTTKRSTSVADSSSSLVQKNSRQEEMNLIRQRCGQQLMDRYEEIFNSAKSKRVISARCFFSASAINGTHTRFVCVRKTASSHRVCERTRINYLLLSLANCRESQHCWCAPNWLLITLDVNARVRSRHAWALKW